jgi:N-acetylglutamate synthase-like GNAT family acetyltransferase
VQFWGVEEDGLLVAVMGIQHVLDVSLIRHAYVRTALRQKGIGARLLGALRVQTSRPLLVGTWAAASWAVRFYEKHGFRLVTPDEKDRLLKKYWSISDRQVQTSVVLADEKWFENRVSGLGSRVQGRGINAEKIRRRPLMSSVPGKE